MPKYLVNQEVEFAGNVYPVNSILEAEEADVEVFVGTGVLTVLPEHVESKEAESEVGEYEDQPQAPEAPVEEETTNEAAEEQTQPSVEENVGAPIEEQPPVVQESDLPEHVESKEWVGNHKV